MTELLKIQDPYATVWVATYEPLIVEWISYQTVADIRVRLLAREVPLREDRSAGTPTIGRYRWSSPRHAVRPTPHALEAAGQQKALLPAVASRAVAPQLDPEERARRRKAINDLLDDITLSAQDLPRKLDEAGIPNIFGPTLHRELSPIGLAHLYRQLYFDIEAGIGPIEQVVAVAPNETLEIVQEVTRRRTQEMIEEFGLMDTAESEVSEEVTDEVAEQVQNSITTDTSIAVSAQAEGSIGIVSAGGSASVDYGTSTERSRDIARRHLLSRTRRSAQIVQRSHTLSVRTSTELTDRSLIRRVIRNDKDAPVNYALRRVMRRILIKVQSLGPRLVWQINICRPGQRLALSRLVMFREADPITQPGLPPNAPPRPATGVENGTQTIQIENDTILVSIPKTAHRTITAITIDSLFDPSPEGKEPQAPALTGEPPQLVPSADQFATYRFNVDPGSASSAVVNYTLYYEPSAAAISEWEQAVAAARQEWESAQREAQFERAKRLIEAKLRVSPRPAADLRQEERYEILNRLISEAFQHTSGRALPAPVEIETFHRLFDVSALFYFVHPSWWEPRYMEQRTEYEITDESAPASMGASLGWLLQLDGDRRRNEFLNSPWVRACIPVRPGMEEEASKWLAQHIEGTRGFSLDPGHPVGKLVKAIAHRRQIEASATPGPDYVTLTGETTPEPSPARAAFPIIDEYEVLQPTEGFVYERITVGS